MKVRLEQDGARVKEGAGLRQAAARTDRVSKEYDREEMRERVLKLEAKYGYQAQRLFEQSIERGPIIRSHEEIIGYAQEAVAAAHEKALERDVVADMRQVWVDAFRHGTSLTTFEAVKGALEESLARGEFAGLVRENQSREQVTDRTMPIENAGIQLSLDEQMQDVEHRAKTADQSLSAHSIAQNSASTPGAVESSAEDHGTPTGGAQGIAEEQLLEHSMELGLAL
jgi:hypothetical protein